MYLPATTGGMDQFVNRIEELDRLQTLYEMALQNSQSSMGAARSARANSSANRLPTATMPCTIRQSKEQRRHNSGDSSRQQRRPIQTSRPSKVWEPLLTYLTDRDAVIVIDEFPYLIDRTGASLGHSTSVGYSYRRESGNARTHRLCNRHDPYPRPRWRCATLRTGVPRHQWPPRTHPAAVSLHPKSSCRRTIPKNGCSSMASLAAHPDISARSIHHRASENIRGCCATRMAHSTTGRETVLQMELNEGEHVFFGSGVDGQQEPQSKRDRSGEPASRAPTRRTTSTGWKPSRSSRNIIRHSPIRRAASGLDTRFEIPYSGFISGISTAAGGSTNSTARTPTRISSNRNCPTSSAKRSNRSVTRRYRRSMQTTSSHRCQASGGTRARR